MRITLLKFSVSLLFVSLVCLWLVFVTGCSGIGRIHTSQGTVVGVKDAGKPATLNTNSSTEGLTLPAGTTVTTTKTAPVPATQDPKSGAWLAFQPAREVTTFTLHDAVRWEKAQTDVSANTGTVDTSIAAKRIDAEKAQPLLYAALASTVAAMFFVWRAYPTPALICGVAAAVFFLAWKVSGLPEWFWAVGAIGLAAAAFLYLGHRRGEADSKLPTTTP